MVAVLVVGGSFAVTACNSRSTAATPRSPIAPTTATTEPTVPITATSPVATPAPTRTSTVTPHRPAVIPQASPRATVAPNSRAQAGKPLAGRIVLVDPGHNGGNAAAPGVINQVIWNGRERETCDTTGTETNSGYTEAQFNYNVARYLTADLESDGAAVVLTRTSNTGVGPCVTERAAIGNNAHANAAISIHADGGPPTGRGFAVLEPVADGPNDAIVAPSETLGLDIRAAFLAGTGEPVSTYDGIDGVQPHDDLAGLNLSTVPKVLIECANMRNATDAALLTTSGWQETAARALAAGLVAYLTAITAPSSDPLPGTKVHMHFRTPPGPRNLKTSGSARLGACC